MGITNWSVIFLYILDALSECNANSVNILGISPTGTLWDAALDITDPGNLTRFSKYETNDKKMYTSVSYDVMNQSVVMETESPKGARRHTFCQGRQLQQGDTLELSSHDNIVGAFTSYKGHLYFLHINDTGSAKYIDLRRWDNRCFEPKRDNSNSEVVNECSVRIANVDYTDESHVYFSPGSNMKVREIGDKLHFLFQFVKYGKKSSGRYVVWSQLYHVTETGKGSSLRRERLHDKFGSWRVRGELSVDWLENVVCWTSIYQLQCAEMYPNGEVHHGTERTVVSSSETVLNGVCTGKNLKALGIITGVAIATASSPGEPLSLFFGCYAQEPGTGGVGLVRVNKSKEIVPLVAPSGEKVEGGSLTIRGSDNMFTDCAVPSSSVNYLKDQSAPIGNVQVTLQPDPKSSDGGDNGTWRLSATTVPVVCCVILTCVLNVLTGWIMC